MSVWQIAGMCVAIALLGGTAVVITVKDWRRGGASLRHQIEELRAALLEQWEAAHFDHCGPLPHSPGDECHWPRPDCIKDERV